MRFKGVEATGYFDKNSFNGEVGEDASWTGLMSKQVLNEGKR